MVIVGYRLHIKLPMAEKSLKRMTNDSGNKNISLLEYHDLLKVGRTLKSEGSF